ncbi:hypothetical protein [Amphritea balenae]|uniref:Kazal-like domain-containing protein n=1 Tax=Amphritea balenae TaxID=452629 RepID=A0A3P1SLR1_9GAMM|nr:hypothetical protein EHS89_16025 [Amphritea balenae]
MVACPDLSSRPQICTRDYRPVCSQGQQPAMTYGNACSACADPSVTGYTPGACSR